LAVGGWRLAVGGWRDAGNSRFYGGIHYQPSINTGLKEGKIIGDNIVSALSNFSEWDK